jgi:DMSO/TMAO reductase YedYZ heme-binding membrane subunit
MIPHARNLTEGWRLLGLITLILLAVTAATFLVAGGGIEGLRSAIRLTARTSLALFLASFLASSLIHLWPSETTRWLRRNRRQIGLGFAVSHLIHGVALVLLLQRDAVLFWQLTNLGNIISGGTAYLMIAAMAATSFNRSAAWMGPRAWSWLHWSGAHYIWISFMVTNGKRVPMSLWYLLPVVLLVAALGLRMTTRYGFAGRRPGAPQRHS